MLKNGENVLNICVEGVEIGQLEVDTKPMQFGCCSGHKFIIFHENSSQQLDIWGLVGSQFCQETSDSSQGLASPCHR